MPDNGKKSSKKLIIIAIAAIVAIAAAVVAIIMILKPKTLDKDFFVSDDTKLVYNVSADISGELYDSSEVYMVYNYSGDTITKLTTYYGYVDEAAAKAALDKYSTIFTPNDDIVEVKLEGRYISLVAKPYLYEGTTVESIRTIIDFQTKGDSGVVDYGEENVIEDADVRILWD
ncbi:MAG: hypothetical protein K6G36_00975 [Candidatus Saccharibacteria bacterium]|nr:hypothetical protein [Candidatus Saccharibacteria bacterium]